MSKRVIHLKRPYLIMNRNKPTISIKSYSLIHLCLCRVKYMLAMYLKYHKAGLTPTTPVTSTAISPVNLSIGRKSLINLRSEMIFLQGKPVFYIFLPSTPPYWQIILRFYFFSRFPCMRFREMPENLINL